MALDADKPPLKQSMSTLCQVLMVDLYNTSTLLYKVVQCLWPNKNCMLRGDYEEATRRHVLLLLLTIYINIFTHSDKAPICIEVMYVCQSNKAMQGHAWQI